MKNKYIIRSQISEAKFREVLKLFVLDILNGYYHCRVFHSHNEFARGKFHVNCVSILKRHATHQTNYRSDLMISTYL